MRASVKVVAGLIALGGVTAIAPVVPAAVIADRGVGGAQAGAEVGVLVCPVAGRTSFSDTWLAPRSGGRQHHGVDMFAAPGTPAVAPVDGIAEHFHDDTGGLSFRLWGEDGNYYFGTHLSSFGTDGTVRAGTVVGYVGATGNAAGTGAHLHFEIHPGRGRGDAPRPVNPTPAVSAACDRSRSPIGFAGAD